MKRVEAIDTILSVLKDDEIVLFTTGMISREAFNVKDRKANFYMIGSMGLLSSVGLGIALNTDKNVIAIDGDGSVLMDMGTMAMIGFLKPKNLVHIVLDNESYQSTGGQPTISSKTELSKIAQKVGYRKSYLFKDTIEANAIKGIIHKEGPTFIQIKVSSESDNNIGRVSLDPVQLSSRISDAINKRKDA